MTIADWTLVVNIIIAIGALATAAMFGAVLYQLVDQRKWNKMSTAFRIIPNHVLLNTIEDELNSSFLNMVDRSEPLTESEVTQLLSPCESKIRGLLKSYLNELESYCVAINMGIVHEEVAERQYSFKIKRYYQELKPYIDKIRTTNNEPRLLEELEKVAMRWSKPKPTTTSY